MEENRCLKCGKPIVGRPDKKFCGMKCKNDYHNNVAAYYRAIRNETMEVLMSNYSILDSLLRSGRSSEYLANLKKMGFEPEYMTGCSKTRGHREERCFDIIYRRGDIKLFSIRRDQSCDIARNSSR